MVRPDRFLADGEKERVLRAVKDAELRTAGEIRVLIVGRSTPRAWLPAALLALVAAGLLYWIQHAAAWGYPGSVEVLISVTVGLAVALAGAWLVPPSRKAKDRAVWKRARREFARLGIGKTSGSTGVLVMLSLWEHEAVALADRAINEKVPPDTWSREVGILLAGVKAGKPGEGIAAAVTEIGALLAKHFPRRDDDVNELPDAVETGK
jgi:putative membrane protein